MRSYLAPAIAACALAALPAHAQDQTGEARPIDVQVAGPALAHQDADLGAKNTALILGEVAGVIGYGKQNWWKDGFRSHFSRANEGWFGQNTYAGGADKLGHFYTNYVGGRLLTSAFRAMGNDPEHALALGTATVLGTMTLVEVLDGYAKGWSFSKEDAITNVLGTGAAVLFEKSPALDELVDLRFTYHKSGIDDGKFDPFGDYSGQTYVLALKASGVPGLRDNKFLRYFELDAGYGVRNYSLARPDLRAQRYRQAYLGISLNLSELLRSADPQGRLPGRQVLDTAFEYLQIPGTSAFKRYRLPTD
jgi:hypothetical protein